MSRYVLVDYLHLAHRCSQAQPLSATLSIAGELKTVDTTIPNYTIKNVFSYSNRGKFPIGVFLEGGRSVRKLYFLGKDSSDGSGYKGNRGSLKSAFSEGVDLAINLMLNGKVSMYRVGGAEADDLIYSAVAKIKESDKITPIDIITNDSDLLPLVDDQVSVYIRGTREHSEPGCPTRRLYYQVTPSTWADYLSYTSAFKEYLIPFNSMLLFKIIRGDKTDNINPAVKGYGGKKYSELMSRMISDGVDFQNTFRYGVDFNRVIAPVLIRYFTPDEVEKMRFIFTGINLIPHALVIPKQIEPGYLQLALNPLKVNLKL